MNKTFVARPVLSLAMVMDAAKGVKSPTSN